MQDVFADRLTQAATCRGKKREDIAAICGVSLKTASRWFCKGKSGALPSIPQLVTICAYLNIRTDWLLFGEGEMRANTGQFRKRYQRYIQDPVFAEVVNVMAEQPSVVLIRILGFLEVVPEMHLPEE